LRQQETEIVRQLLAVDGAQGGTRAGAHRRILVAARREELIRRPA